MEILRLDRDESPIPAETIENSEKYLNAAQVTLNTLGDILSMVYHNQIDEGMVYAYCHHHFTAAVKALSLYIDSARQGNDNPDMWIHAMVVARAWEKGRSVVTGKTFDSGMILPFIS